MENQELDILIQRYLDGELNATEKTAFETSMSGDESIKKAVQEYILIEKAVKTFAVSQIKIDLQKAHKTVSKTKSFNNYKPSLNAGGGFNIFSFLTKIILLGGIVSVVLIYVGKMPVEHKLIEELNEKMHSIDLTIKQDTVWTTIKSTGVAKGDTVLIRNQAELDKWKKENKGAKNIKIRKIPSNNIGEPNSKEIEEESEENWD